MKVFRRIVLGISLALFIFMTPLSLLSLNAEQTLLSYDDWAEALDESGFYEALPAAAGDFLAAFFYAPATCAENPVFCAESGLYPPEFQACLQEALSDEAYQNLRLNLRPPEAEERRVMDNCIARYQVDPDLTVHASFFALLDAQDWQVLIADLVPAKMWRGMVEATLVQGLAALNGDADVVTLNLDALTMRIENGQAAESLIQLTQSKAPCTPTDLYHWVAYVAGNPQRPSLCQWPPDRLPEIKRLLDKALRTQFGDLPTSLVLLRLDEETHDTVAGIRILMRMFWLLPAFLLMLISVLAITSPRSWLQWWGMPLALAGLFGLALSWGLVESFASNAHHFLQEEAVLASRSVVSMLLNLFEALLMEMIRNLRYESLGMLVLGGAAWLGARFWPERARS